MSASLSVHPSSLSPSLLLCSHVIDYARKYLLCCSIVEGMTPEPSINETTLPAPTSTPPPSLLHPPTHPPIGPHSFLLLPSPAGTYQGYANDSTWTRGHAWSIYGYAMIYRYIPEPRFLDRSLGLFRQVWFGSCLWCCFSAPSPAQPSPQAPPPLSCSH